MPHFSLYSDETSNLGVYDVLRRIAPIPLSTEKNSFDTTGHFTITTSQRQHIASIIVCCKGGNVFQNVITKLKEKEPGRN